MLLHVTHKNFSATTVKALQAGQEEWHFPYDLMCAARAHKIAMHPHFAEGRLQVLTACSYV